MKSFKLIKTIGLLIVFAACYRNVFAMQTYESRKKRLFGELLAKSKSNQSFGASANCVGEYLSFFYHEPLEFGIGEFEGLFGILQKKAQNWPVLQEDVNDRLSWNYGQYPLIISAAKRLKRKLNKQYITNPEFVEKKIQDIDIAIAMIEQFNAGKPDPKYGTPILK